MEAEGVADHRDCILFSYSPSAIPDAFAAAGNWIGHALNWRLVHAQGTGQPWSVASTNLAIFRSSGQPCFIPSGG